MRQSMHSRGKQDRAPLCSATCPGLSRDGEGTGMSHPLRLLLPVVVDTLSSQRYIDCIMTAQRHQADINLDPVFEALERPLALIDSPERRDEMQRFAAASRGYQERAIFDLLS